MSDRAQKLSFTEKAGLSLGSAGFLWLMSTYGYMANQPQTAQTLEGIRMCSSIYVAVLFGVCTVLLAVFKLNKHLTQQIADELEARRQAPARA